MRSLLFVIFFTSIFARPLLSAAEDDPSAPLAENAAIQYWQAFAFMPTLDDDQKKILEGWKDAPIDVAAKALIANSKTSIMYLHRGAKKTHCHWGLDYNDGMGLLMPHLAKARDLARLAALHARLELQEGRPEQARDDLTAIITLARHAGSEPVLISMLVSFVIEDVAIDFLAATAPELKASYSKTVAHYESLPKVATLDKTILIEKEFMAKWAIRKLREEEKRQPGAGPELWKQLLGTAEVSEKLKNIKSTDTIISMIEDMLPLYDELARIVGLPSGEFEKEYAEFLERNKVPDSIAGLLLPQIDRVVARQRRNQARTAMLLAAIAVVESGPEKLQDIKDPFGDGPFEYRALDKGFELQSDLMFEDKPVTLTVGTAESK